MIASAEILHLLGHTAPQPRALLAYPFAGMSPTDILNEIADMLDVHKPRSPGPDDKITIVLDPDGRIVNE